MKKITKSFKIEDYQVLTDDGFVDVNFIHETIPYNIWKIITDDDLSLSCADEHILFLYPTYEEIFIKNLKIGDKIITNTNKKYSIIKSILEEKEQTEMYDLELDNNSNHRFYSNNILSHNTQLFRILSGLNKPTTGTVLVNGKPVMKGDVGVVAQYYPLFMHRTVQSNLELGASKSSLSKKDKLDKIKMYLEKFKISDKADFYPASLSGGQRQRVAIIQQLLCSEHFLLLDEPFSGLDVNMIKEVSDVILNIANLDELNTVIIVSHDIPSTVAISTNLWILGFDYDEQGNPIPGARIKYVEDLMEKGISWQYPEVFELPEFNSMVRGIRDVFKTL